MKQIQLHLLFSNQGMLAMAMWAVHWQRSTTHPPRQFHAPLPPLCASRPSTPFFLLYPPITASTCVYRLSGWWPPTLETGVSEVKSKWNTMLRQSFHHGIQSCFTLETTAGFNESCGTWPTWSPNSQSLTGIKIRTRPWISKLSSQIWHASNGF